MNNLSLEDRFMKYVQKSDDPDGCWEWIGCKNSDGYGSFKINNKTYSSHRVSYALFIGDIPDRMLVCHSCDNPNCVNPAHLWLGTNKDNVTDMYNKGRQSHVGAPKGENHWSHKLTEQKIYQIHKMIEQGHAQRKIAKMFEISESTVSYIKSNLRWKHIK